jgi:2-dehydro-3-deoxygalactonokinase
LNAHLRVLGDWGTSHLRLFLSRGDEVIDRREGPGISRLEGNPEAALFALLVPWIASHGQVPILLSGMVGSRNGWKEVPYAACPADAKTLSRATLKFRAREHEVMIVPGLSCRNPRGAMDLLRGEETQIIGALDCHSVLATRRHLLCLPGTHAKWVLLEEGRIVSFQTSLTGEVFALLDEHSMLLRVRDDRSFDPSADTRAFDDGLGRSGELPRPELLHLLFEARSRQLQGELTASQAREWLSGLLIGYDVRGATELFPRESRDEPQVLVIGATDLAERYRKALTACGIPAISCDATKMTLAGLRALSRAA